jgi:vacuolar-type H+-ATPase subunit E/Vma4
MAEEIKELIEKINREGIKAAEDKAKETESAALKKAEEIVSKAKKEAERILAEGRDKLSKTEEKGRALLAQAGRDLLLNLKEEINNMLGVLISADLRQSLTPEALAKIIIEMAKAHAEEGKDIIVSLNPADKEALEKGFLLRLKEEANKNITLSPQGEISAGFAISFDSGKSQYDFSDRALADYIGGYLKPKLKNILSVAAKSISTA